MALLLRLAVLGHAFGYNFTIALVILSIVSMTLGNLVAIVQKDFKRMLAYSSIAHAGVFLMGVLTITEAGYIGAIYYALAYLVMNFTVFMVLSEVATDGRDLKIAELAGLYRRSPLLAMSLILGIFALAGVPPSIGFTGKLLIFTSAMNAGYFWLVLIGAVNGTICLYYYLKVIYAAYFIDDPGLPAIQLSLPIRLLNYALAAIIIGFGFFPDRSRRLVTAAPSLKHEPHSGDFRIGGRAAFHRFYGEIAYFYFGHERRLLLAGPDRRGERHHLPLLLSEGHLCRLLHR